MLEVRHFSKNLSLKSPTHFSKVGCPSNERGDEMSQTEPLDSTSKTEVLSPLALQALAPQPIPHHIAIIPDGNRRWAKERELKAEQGHASGADSLIDMVKGAKDIGVKVLTIFGFSTENGSRTPLEVEALMFLMERYLIEQREEMKKNGIRCCHIGDLNPLPDSLKQALKETEEATAQCGEIDFVVALNYGGRDDIRRAVQKLLMLCEKGELSSAQLTEDVISQHLDTYRWPDPDLLIRTSGEMRISNFLLWQASYSEFFHLDLFWPDFTPQHLLDVVVDYQKRNRRHGI